MCYTENMGMFAVNFNIFPLLTYFKYKYSDVLLNYNHCSTAPNGHHDCATSLSLSIVLHCDKTRWSFENTREM